MWFIKFVLFGMMLEGGNMVNHGDLSGLVFVVGAAFLLFWRRILFWIMDRRWRDDFRKW